MNESPANHDIGDPTPSVLETPAQVEAALDRAFANYFSITTVRAQVQAARTRFPTQFESSREMHLDEELSAYLKAQHLSEWRPIRPAALTTVFIATLNPTKQGIFTEAATTTGLQLRFQQPGFDEEIMHDYADTQNVLLHWFPFHIASQKAIRNAPTAHPWRLTEPRIGVDTVVIVNNEVLHKPKDEQEARQRLRAISGADVIVRTAIFLDMTTYAGEYLDWIGGSAIKIPIAPLSDNDIDRYVAQNLTTALEVAGGIDYTSAAALPLINEEKPIEVLPVEIGVTEANLETELTPDWERSIKLKPTAVQGLRTHLKGVPLQPLRGIFRNIKQVYAEI